MRTEAGKKILYGWKPCPIMGDADRRGRSIIWGILKHYEHTETKITYRSLACVVKGVEFLLAYKDADTGLPG